MGRRGVLGRVRSKATAVLTKKPRCAGQEEAESQNGTLVVRRAGRAGRVFWEVGYCSVCSWRPGWLAGGRAVSVGLSFDRSKFGQQLNELGFESGAIRAGIVGDDSIFLPGLHSVFLLNNYENSHTIGAHVVSFL
jgi:hypothetical protein